MSITNILQLCCGLGLFLYGMKIMGDGLEKAAGNKMQKIIEALTKKPYKWCNCWYSGNCYNSKF